MKSRTLTLVIIALFIFFFVISYFPSSEKSNQTASTIKSIESKQIFSQTEIKANAAYVKDVSESKIVFNKNADLPLPLASVTKLMTILVASEMIQPDEIVTVSSSSIATEGDSGLVIDERWKFKDLADFTLLVSSNDGANVLATAAAKKSGHNFVDEMNQRAKELGFSSFHFENESGLDLDDTTASNYGSAKDVSALMEYLLKNHPELLGITKHSDFVFTSLSGKIHRVKNTDAAIGKVSYIVASKTGFTDLAGGNLSVVYNAGLNHPIIITVLGSTSADRFEDIVNLASSTAAYILEE